MVGGDPVQAHCSVTVHSSPLNDVQSRVIALVNLFIDLELI